MATANGAAMPSSSPGAGSPSSSVSTSSSSLRVTVEPGQSSFFAGEYFHCKITFSNVATPPARSHQQLRQEYDDGTSTPTSGMTSRSRSGRGSGAASPSTSSTTSPSASGTSTPNRSTSRGSQHTRKASSSLHVANANTNRAFSHGKSQSLYDVRPVDADKVGAGEHARTPVRRERRGLVGRGPKPAELRSQAGNDEEDHGNEPASRGTKGATKVSHGKSVSVAVAQISSSAKHGSEDARGNLHGLGLGLPGRRGSGGSAAGYPASRNASGASEAGSSDTARTPSSSYAVTGAVAPRGGARPGSAAAPLQAPEVHDGQTKHNADDSFDEENDGVQKVSKQHPRVFNNTAAKAKSLVSRTSGRHPHSRKKSVVQTQVEDLTEAFALEMGLEATPEESSAAASPAILGGNGGLNGMTEHNYDCSNAPGTSSTEDGNAAGSRVIDVGDDSFASATSKAGGPGGVASGFYGIGRNDTMESVVREDLSERLASSDKRTGPVVGRRGGLALGLDRRLSNSSNRSMLSPTNLSIISTHFPASMHRSGSAAAAAGSGVGDSSPTIPAASSAAPSTSPLFPAPAHANVAPGSEVLLWSYAQFSGMFSIDESLIKPFDFELVKYRIAQGTFVSASSASSGGRGASSGIVGPGGRSELQLQRQTPSERGGAASSRGRTIGGGELLSIGQEDVEAELRMGDDTGSAGGIGGESGAGGPEETAAAMRRAISGQGMGKSFEADGWTAYLRNRLTLGSGGAAASDNGMIGGASGGSGGAGGGGMVAGLLRRGHKHKRTGSTLVDTSQKALLAKGIPTFSTPPSILCVDLALEPGQSRSYHFRLPLPPDLPPSYLGKAISFTYTLAIGTNRLDLSNATVRSSSRKSAQKSRLIQIPIRIYNHVAVSGARPFWDLLNPIVWVRDGAVISPADDEAEGEDAEDALDAAAPPPPLPLPEHVTAAEGAQELANLKKKRDESSHVNLVSYAKELLASCATPTGSSFDASSALTDSALQPGETSTIVTATLPAPHLSARSLGKALMRRRSSVVSAASRAGAEEDTIDTCMEAVEVLSRTSSKVSYDIAKDGQIAAVLTLVKSKLRLGDTVSGVITINQKTAYARIIRVAVHLESHEEIQSDIATLPSTRSQKLTKRAVASHHDSTLDAGQVSFALPIPSGATPDFTTSGVKLLWTIRLSLLTLTSVKPPASPKSSSRSNIYNGGPHAPIPPPAPSASKRALPPPHLVPGTPDGFALYHQSLRALPSLCGPLPSFTPDESHRSFLKRNGYGVEAKLEIVECSVPLVVLPNSTRFKTASVRFAA
ncbi:Rgp1-domain-containing protein [Tilletiaria anomala UBC 951]|uniref:Rgp1-domain-containing protein n=1 Tax=Tilletiaria anomala (strain ATCC 24038 / CBS 436.72 / UBC 951) TaxID=1037660 RepID=A0A066WIA9_TILAU|nr:Rgp1-domain-containing protein [Tilletiaria anomala UBC 951]KDN50410.1 Rgp1-domain-containing protein [Tilletiaria anomala UBC 951]